MKRKDLTGQKFGKLLVVEMRYGVKCGSRNRTMCLCLCDCGNTVLTKMDALQFGKKVSCGCDTSERRSASLRRDLTGRRFGRLVVMHMDYEQKPTRAMCRCDCGNCVSVIASQLPYGKTKSCGCLHVDRIIEASTKDWTAVVSHHGIKFIKQARRNKANQWLWECECGLCGRHFDALPAKVMNGHVTSCGCRKRSAREELVRSTLLRLGVSFCEQFSFPDCRDKQVLLFDFAIFFNEELFCLIEYDEEQHYKPIQMYGGNAALEASMRRDEIKNNYCAEHHIDLYRLPYTLTDDDIIKEIEDIVIRRDCNACISNDAGFAVLQLAG